MRGNRGRDTQPELHVRRAIHAAGLRYRVNVRPLKGLNRTADIVFTRRRIAVFIDGCYWHRCPCHYRAPATNAEFWRDKIKGNIERDLQTTDQLERAGWTVMRFWEHVDSNEVAAQIVAAVREAS